LYFQGAQFGMAGGTLPSSIGSLSQLTAMNFLGTGLTGTLPKSIMNLKELTVIQVAMNKFTGLVPPLPFNQYWGWCGIVHNNWQCPLPPGALGCDSGCHDDPSCIPSCE
jgi:hypothetical protein